VARLRAKTKELKRASNGPFYLFRYTVLVNKREKEFVKLVWEYFEKEGRYALPWRQTTDPYRILVSELMLQQTQVERVIPKYEAFIKKWPTVQKLAKAELGEVLIMWQGLGYNRRAKFLHQCAGAIACDHSGIFPRTRKELEALPGIGPYTAGAIMAFSYNSPVILIETNVRRVYLHHFFPNQTDVPDSDIFLILEKTVPVDKARDWYSALMDYGTYLKKTIANPNVRSRHYAKQSKFVGSDREIRGAILKVLSRSAFGQEKLQENLCEFDQVRVQGQVEVLLSEGMIHVARGKYCL
jgi:A/G-specific adenine glycosylase